VNEKQALLLAMRDKREVNNMGRVAVPSAVMSSPEFTTKREALKAASGVKHAGLGDLKKKE
jgi:hypothetical protein